MKRLYHNILFAAVFLLVLPVQTLAAELLIPGGQIIGLQLQNGTVTVAAFDDALGAAARESGLKIGDEIRSVNGQQVTCAEDVRAALKSGGDPVSLSIRRSGKSQKLTVCPSQTPDGPRLGIHLKQGISGIGTVTWYEPGSGKFGTLGHGVNDSSGRLLNMVRGTAYHAGVISVKKGKSGEPGLLKGSAEASDVWGSLTRNTAQGVFGITKQPLQGEPLPVADFEEIHTGGATIRSTVAGRNVQEYSVEILKIYAEDRTDGRNFLIRVTDPDLLAATGGIVQGMSGSPIIQDGKLIGAVTHVLVSSPETGYGIFIENMMDAAA